MKKLTLLASIVFILALSSSTFAAQVATWHSVDKNNWGTVAWDAVTKLADGDPLPEPAVATVGYNVYAKNVVTNAQVTIATNLPGVERQIVLPSRGSYIVGVQAQLLYVGDSQPSLSSTIAWTEEPSACQNGATFGFRFQTGPMGTGGLRRKTGS